MASKREIPWVIKESTKVKHRLLQKYMGQWMGILFSAQEKRDLPEVLLYFDGFSGPGMYWEDESRQSTVPGSPTIVAEIANKYLDDKPSRQVIIIAIDKDEDCVTMLSDRFKEINKHNQQWTAYHAEFEDAVNSLFDQIESEGLHRPPMFVFVDPFGYSGFTMRTLERLLNYRRVELFITLMIYDITRFCSTEQHEERMHDLYECSDFKEAVSFGSPDKKQLFLMNLYCRQLTVSAKATFVMPFRVNTPSQGTRPRYYLIHASNNFKALRVMKDSMFKVSDTLYGFEAIGLLPDQLALFEDPAKITLKERINTFCKEAYPKTLDYQEIDAWGYVNTGGVSQTIKRVLVELEQRDKVLKIIRKPRQHKNTVTAGAKIVYLTQGERTKDV